MDLGSNLLRLSSLQKFWSVDTVFWLCSSQLWNIKMALIAAHLNLMQDHSGGDSVATGISVKMISNVVVFVCFLLLFVFSCWYQIKRALQRSTKSHQVIVIRVSHRVTSVNCRDCLVSSVNEHEGVSRFGVRQVSEGTSVRISFGSPFSSKVVVCRHCLVTLSLTVMKH